MSNIMFTQNQFQSFMSLIQVLKESVTDISVVEGKIFQENDKKNIIYDIDLSEIFGDNTVYLDSIPIKGNILDIFRRQNSKMILNITDNKYIWHDDKSSVNFAKPSVQYLTSKPLSKNSTRALNATHISDDIIFDLTFEQDILERFNAARRSLESKEIVIAINESVANFTMFYQGINSTISNTIFTASDNDIFNDSYKGLMRLPIDPFLIPSDTINVLLGVNKSDKTKFTLKIESTLNDINIISWCTTLFKTKSE